LEIDGQLLQNGFQAEQTMLSKTIGILLLKENSKWGAVCLISMILRLNIPLPG
jgi:hypothetical protein